MNIISANLSYPQKSFYGQPQGSTGQMSSPSSAVKTTIFYTNDVHGQIPKMERLVSASKDAGLGAAKSGADILRLCSGDTFIGKDEKRNEVGAEFLDIAEFDAETLGNHEFDLTASICGNLLKDRKTKILGMNTNFPDNNSVLAQKTLRSTVVDGKNGEKYGLIGLQPSDLESRIRNKELLEGITVDNTEETKKELQEEINNLQNQGINKIILLSHEGNKVEKELAQTVSGIDVILGGHSHDLIKDIKEGENLFYSPTGEPVVITQAGRDGNHYGLLNLEFDDQGKITYVQNNIRDTNEHSSNLIMAKITDGILGKSPETGELKEVKGQPENIMIAENPWADFVADAIKEKLDSEIVLINSANFRGSVDTGKVTERDISSIFPFNNKLAKISLSEKDLVDAIKKCAKSVSSNNHKPGILQVSGLKYTLDSQGELKELKYIDKTGNEKNIDINNPDPEKKYVTVYDEFLYNGGDDLDMLVPKEEDFIEKYDFDKDKVTSDYIRTLDQPFTVSTDGRIKVE